MGRNYIYWAHKESLTWPWSRTSPGVNFGLTVCGFFYKSLSLSLLPFLHKESKRTNQPKNKLNTFCCEKKNKKTEIFLLTEIQNGDCCQVFQGSVFLWFVLLISFFFFLSLRFFPRIEMCVDPCRFWSVGFGFVGLDERLKESRNIIAKYPDRVPVSLISEISVDSLFSFMVVGVRLWISYVSND